MRIAGLASGMDIESMVKDLMRAERMPLDKLKQKKQFLEWQRDDYRALNTKMLSFRDKLANLKLTPNYRARTVTSSNDTYVSATVTSGASQASYSISKVEQLASAAVRVGGTLTEIDNSKIDPAKSLFDQQDVLNMIDVWKDGVVETKNLNGKKGDKILSLNLGPDEKLQIPNEISVKVNGQTLKVVTDREPTSGEVKIENGELKFGVELSQDSTVKVEYALESKTKSINTKENDVALGGWNLGVSSISTLSLTFTGEGVSGTYILGEEKDGIAQLINADGDAGDGPLKIGEINLATGVITFEGFGADGKDGIPPNTEIEATFTQNYSSFGINTQTSKGEIQETIFMTGNDTLNNVIRKVNDSSAGVTMYYDSFANQVSLTRKETGDYKDGAGNEITVSGNFLLKTLNFEKSSETGGQNAMFTINGLSTERSTNTFQMSGVTFTIKQIFNKDNVDIQPISISIANDTNQVFENIKAFVTQYNELIAEINGKLNEERYRSYKPLTDDEREELSDKQQEKWEEMAKSGLLKGDPVLSSVLTNMRLDMSSVVETNGLFKQLATIGIKTTANYLEGGKLEIDEAKLKEAIEKDPQSVENLFRGDGTTSDRGVVHRLYDTVDAAMKKLQERAGRATSTNQQFTIGRELDNVDKGITRFEQKMKLTEDRYWRQFTAMEKAIQKANQQSMYLMQQFGGL
ncbi:flagellar filament capping protein FliD [Lederbergia panacisoli]|uniref:flagellar filament capping protein FliD n=1 Tax=Lederbergia panacisoli TaxID=1255251 RepID=UPI00214AB00A|nr:flagellar filament capping protein FliD [Lederbergia panacisoli]MCR2822386.1 flagellar filament capping protein FliD [Lederbergia panacisoli]